MTVDPTPEEFRGVTPHLVVADAEAAADFYTRAFGADVFHKAYGPDGRIWHVELLIAGGRLLLVTPVPDMGIDVPAGSTSVMLHMYVPDADTAYATALAAGATPVMEPWDSFWGDRYCQILDPYGHRWAIASKTEDLSVEETRERGDAYITEHPNAPRPD
jgi:PhnB protein